MNAAIEYCRLLVELHRLIALDLGDSSDADAIRERMEQPWSQLSEAEVEQTNALSEDLYALVEAVSSPLPADARRMLDSVSLEDLKRRMLLKTDDLESAIDKLRQSSTQKFGAS